MTSEANWRRALDQTATFVIALLAVAALFGGSFLTMMAQMGAAGCAPSCNYALLSFAGFLTPVVGIVALIAMAVVLRGRPSGQRRWWIAAVAFAVIAISTVISLSLTAITL